MKKFVLIVAGGSGSRMGSDIPKQFLELNGRPILMHTVERFFNFDPDIARILVLPESQIETWRELCDRFSFSIPCEIAKGGQTRFHSVKNGLAKILAENGLVAIHDGVRPFVSFETIARCFDMAAEKGNAIPVIRPVESIRTFTADGNSAVDRNRYVLVQTPQVFDLKEISLAYSQPFDSAFSDDASVLEHMGKNINLVAGNRENIKITEPFDLSMARAMTNHI